MYGLSMTRRSIGTMKRSSSPAKSVAMPAVRVKSQRTLAVFLSKKGLELAERGDEGENSSGPRGVPVG